MLIAIDDVRLLKLMIDNDCITHKMVDELIELAEKKNNIEAKELLIKLYKEK